MGRVHQVSRTNCGLSLPAHVHAPSRHHFRRVVEEPLLVSHLVIFAVFEHVANSGGIISLPVQTHNRTAERKRQFLAGKCSREDAGKGCPGCTRRRFDPAARRRFDSRFGSRFDGSFDGSFGSRFHAGENPRFHAT